MSQIVIINKNLLGTSLKKGDVCLVTKEITGSVRNAFFVKSCETGTESVFVITDLDFIC